MELYRPPILYNDMIIGRQRFGERNADPIATDVKLAIKEGVSHIAEGWIVPFPF